MATSVLPDIITPEQLAALPNSRDYELVDGRLVERNMGNKAAWVATQINCKLANHVQGHQLGWVFTSDNGFRIDPDRPNLVRRPDISFVRFGRFPSEEPSDVYDQLAPDLAVEVVSPGDASIEVEEKVNEYLAAGVRLVWVVQPTVQRIMIYRGDGTLAALRASDELSGEDVIPGFRCSIAELFQPPVPRTSA